MLGLAISGPGCGASDAGDAAAAGEGGQGGKGHAGGAAHAGGDDVGGRTGAGGSTAAPGGTAGASGAGASGAGDGGAGSGGMPPSVDDVCAAQADAYCTHAIACGLTFQTNYDYGTPGDQKAACLGYPKALCEAKLTSPFANVTTAMMQACAEAYKSASCYDLLAHTVLPACTPPGKLAAGEACSFDAECQGDYCQRSSGQVCGVCVTPGAVGGACGGKAEGPCGYGSTCDAGGHCAALSDNGGSCKDGVECVQGTSCDAGVCRSTAMAQKPGQPCDNVLRCDSSLGTCVQTASGNVCKGYPQAGQACHVPDTTDDGTQTCAASFCDAKSGKAGVCHAPPKVGQACGDVAGNGVDFVCVESATCVKKAASDKTGTCQPLPKAGAACADPAGNSMYLECAEGARCVALEPTAKTLTCVAPGALGGTCTLKDGFPIGCSEGVCAIGPDNTGVCVPPAKLGEACDRDLLCDPALACAFASAEAKKGVCVAPSKLGDPCVADAKGNVCDNSHCVEEVGNFVCDKTDGTLGSVCNGDAGEGPGDFHCYPPFACAMGRCGLPTTCTAADGGAGSG